MESLRTAIVKAEVEFKITARASEGQMVDAVQEAIHASAHTVMCEEHHITKTTVIPVGEPGGNL